MCDSSDYLPSIISPYGISSNGVVCNLKTGKILAVQLNKGGYQTIKLKGKVLLIHRLVAMAYIPNVDNKPEIDHINRVKTDNNVNNLRWASRQENEVNKIMNKNNTSGFRGIYCDPNYKWVLRIRLKNNSHGFPENYFKVFNNVEDAIIERLNILTLVYGNYVSI
jgi:hypothetical protein